MADGLRLYNKHCCMGTGSQCCFQDIPPIQDKLQVIAASCFIQCVIQVACDRITVTTQQLVYLL